MTRTFVALLIFPAVALAQDYTLLGAGVRSRPDYDGSDKQKIDLIPVVRYYGRPWFARTTQGILEGGARAELAPGLAVGAQLAYEAGRENPDVDAGASAGAHLEWDAKLGPAPLNLLARLRQHLDSDHGSQADARATVGIYGQRGLQAGVFGQATWASSKFVRTFYTAGSGGLLFTSLGLLGSYDLARPWVIVGSVEGRRLHGDTASSPITKRKSNFYASAGLAYRF